MAVLVVGIVADDEVIVIPLGSQGVRQPYTSPQVAAGDAVVVSPLSSQGIGW